MGFGRVMVCHHKRTPPLLCTYGINPLVYRMPLKSYTSKHISGACDVASVCLYCVGARSLTLKSSYLRTYVGSEQAVWRN